MPKEIFFCDLIVLKDKKPFRIEKCVWLEGEKVYKRMEIKEVIKIKKFGISSELTMSTLINSTTISQNDSILAYIL
jgi:hypothetical protein